MQNQKMRRETYKETNHETHEMHEKEQEQSLNQGKILYREESYPIQGAIFEVYRA